MNHSQTTLSLLALLGLAAALVGYRAAFCLARHVALSPAAWPVPASAR
jgi:hypothetical protein